VHANNSRSYRFALTKHLRRDEVIYPLEELGKFRGEPVYPRANVQRLKAAEGWMREGRMISIGQQPLKRVKARATTIERKRVLQAAKADGEQEEQQGLYAKWQTEPYVPEPVVDVRALPFRPIVLISLI
jgi:xeroderma pigmentosum group C-complementing protein